MYNRYLLPVMIAVLSSCSPVPPGNVTGATSAATPNGGASAISPASPASVPLTNGIQMTVDGQAVKVVEGKVGVSQSGGQLKIGTDLMPVSAPKDQVSYSVQFGFVSADPFVFNFTNDAVATINVYVNEYKGTTNTAYYQGSFGRSTLPGQSNFMKDSSLTLANTDKVLSGTISGILPGIKPIKVKIDWSVDNALKK